MPKVSNAAKLAEVQGKAVERILGKVRREVRNGFLTEERGEERMSRMLSLGEKLGPLNASPEAMAEYWGLIEVTQAKLDGMVQSERVRYVEDVEAEL
jgi:hypothetical protein